VSTAVPVARGPWWRDRRRRDRVTVWGFAVLGIGGILLGASLTFARGDQRVVVVTLKRDPSQSEQQLADERQQLKQECGGLPGVTVVADEGDPSVQGRFPVRFGIRGADNATRASLDACLARHADVVRGVRTEGE
jgi:hypothetical protein